MGHTRSIISFNYEKNFYRFNDRFSLSARTGLGIEPGYKVDGEKYRSRKTIPTVLLLQVGRKTHFINMGAGYSATFVKHLTDNTGDVPKYYPRYESAYSMSVGYRFAYDGVMAQFYPVYILPNDSDAEISFGISFGFVW